MRKRWFSLFFRGAACLQAIAGFAMLFVLFRSYQGSWWHRALFIAANEQMLKLAWTSSLLAIFAVIGTFSILVVALDREFRIILQWAWMISLIGGTAFLINHLVQMMLLPLLSEWFIQIPSPNLLFHLHRWDRLLDWISFGFGPGCLAVSGLIFTAVMFRTREFSLSVNWGSFAVWSILLLESVSFRWMEVGVPVFLSLAFLIYIPWLFFTAEQLQPTFPARDDPIGLPLK
jgi:hypothetical protein